MDAIEALEELKEYCEKRESSYRGWGDDAQAFDMKQLQRKIENKIKELTPSSPSSK